jgi:hypothetical protein
VGEEVGHRRGGGRRRGQDNATEPALAKTHRLVAVRAHCRNRNSISPSMPEAIRLRVLTGFDVTDSGGWRRTLLRHMSENAPMLPLAGLGSSRSRISLTGSKRTFNGVDEGAPARSDVLIIDGCYTDP